MTYEPGTLLKVNEFTDKSAYKPYLYPVTGDLKSIIEKNIHVFWNKDFKLLDQGTFVLLLEFIKVYHGCFGFVLYDGKYWNTSIFGTNKAFTEMFSKT